MEAAGFPSCGRRKSLPPGAAANFCKVLISLNLAIGVQSVLHRNDTNTLLVHVGQEGNELLH
jgi:hypothetical protein